MSRNKENRRNKQHETKHPQFYPVSPEGVISEVRGDGADLAMIGLDSSNAANLKSENSGKQQDRACHRRAGHKRSVYTGNTARHTNSVVHPTSAPSGMRF